MRMTVMVLVTMMTVVGTLAPEAAAGGKLRKAVARAVRHSVRDAVLYNDTAGRVRHGHPQRQYRQPRSQLSPPPVRSAPRWTPPVRPQYTPRRTPPARCGEYGNGAYAGACGGGYGVSVTVSPGPLSRWIARRRDPYRGHSFDYWIDRMLNHHDEDDREDAAKRLGKIGDPRAIPYLEQAAEYDREGDVRRKARKAIRRILRHR